MAIQKYEWTGCFTALATPFRDGRVDYETLARLVEHQIAGGVRGIVPCGTTGESPTLSEKEHHEVVEFVIRQAKRRCLVLAGTGSNCTAVAIERTVHARDAGADGALLVTPYYNKPTQEGLFQHFEAIANAVPGFALILYDIPGRTGVSLEVETVVRLSKINNIAGIKEAAGKVERITALRQATSLYLLSGDDAMTLPMMALGAHGVISVASNVMPADVAGLVQAAADGNFGRARELHEQLAPMFRALFVEPNPAPVKYALERIGIFKNSDVRLPLVPVTERARREVQNALALSGCASQA